MISVVSADRGDAYTICAGGMDFRELGRNIRQAVARGARRIYLEGVCGQRYIAAGLTGDVSVVVRGVPGNDLGAFMDGPHIRVIGNVQDAVANTMSGGEIVVHGHARNVLCYAMRGGRVYVRGDAGYRAGINMKAAGDRCPVLVIGGAAGGFLGEYMAGGRIVVLGTITGGWTGAGMHGGAICLRGGASPDRLSPDVRVCDLEDGDWSQVQEDVSEYCRFFDLDPDQFLASSFVKLVPRRLRPYGDQYTHDHGVLRGSALPAAGKSPADSNGAVM